MQGQVRPWRRFSREKQASERGKSFLWWKNRSMWGFDGSLVRAQLEIQYIGLQSNHIWLGDEASGQPPLLFLFSTSCVWPASDKVLFFLLEVYMAFIECLHVCVVSVPVCPPDRCLDRTSSAEVQHSYILYVCNDQMIWQQPSVVKWPEVQNSLQNERGRWPN